MNDTEIAELFNTSRSTIQYRRTKQARNLQAAKKELKKEKSDLKATLRLTPDAKLSSRDKRRLAASVSKAKR
ncbi:hypothetical protein D1156_06270, partial [Neglecta sp. X58]|nr:hypothetical protein [Neglectibacter sp. X58]